MNTKMHFKNSRYCEYMFLTHSNQAFLYRMQDYDTGYIKDAGYIKQDTGYRNRLQETGTR